MVRNKQTARKSAIPQYLEDNDLYHYEDEEELEMVEVYDTDDSEEVDEHIVVEDPASIRVEDPISVEVEDPVSLPTPSPEPVPDPVESSTVVQEVEIVRWTSEVFYHEGHGIPMAVNLGRLVYGLEYGIEPLYRCELWTHPWFQPLWEVTAIIRKIDPRFGVPKEVSCHSDIARRDTMEAGIAEAARRALYVLSHKERPRLEHTGSRYTPYRASREAKTYIAPLTTYDPALDNLRELLAATNTALDDTNNTLAKTQEKVIILEAQKRALEATLQGREIPVIEEDAELDNYSPSHKGPRYDSPDAHVKCERRLGVCLARLKCAWMLVLVINVWFGSL
ncbi:hypothetical protein PVAP13_8KG372504 [Panicum virgatum]|uniref:Uncharacterized protein n=1 Tax=Panicum virgatum TaxID=38727 RepID=A0A8T0PQD2_PANVG|nr:hypothetical protein PVAP13_8KG372202 [Panicum virgatum]KAG2563900.1 hypothetical protein PVAP13_8KG372504 [Panicum virgatum]